jgi:hypothetical protein
MYSGQSDWTGRRSQLHQQHSPEMPAAEAYDHHQDIASHLAGIEHVLTRSPAPSGSWPPPASKAALPALRAALGRSGLAQRDAAPDHRSADRAVCRSLVRPFASL